MLDDAGPAQALLAPEAIEAEDVAEAFVASLADDRFLVLPHSQVGEYYALRATRTDRWLAGMRKLQAGLDSTTP